MSKLRQAGRRRNLNVMSLEGRDLPSASPLPVLLVIADQRDFYYREYNDTRNALLSRGVDVVVAATTTQPSTPHWNTGQPAGTLGTITPQIALANAKSSDYSAIAFVGGWGSSMYQYAYNDPNFDGVIDNYYSDLLYNGDSNLTDGQIAAPKVAVNNLINEFLADDKPVAAICHGVTVLAWARVDGVSPLSGKNVAVPLTVGSPDQFFDGKWRNGGYYSGQRDQVVANGGLANTVSGAVGNPTTTADDVVVDGRIITAENFDTSTQFGLRIADEVIALLPPPPAVVSGGNIVVTGTPGPDVISISHGSAANQVVIGFNGQNHGPLTLPAGGRVVVHGNAGDDLIRGGLGNDLLLGGDGDDIIVGGPGVDQIEGGNGRDLLIGGLGADQINGGAGDDLLIGGTTSHDNDDDALRRLHTTWIKSLRVTDRLPTSDTLSKFRVAAQNDGAVDTYVATGADRMVPS